VLQSEPVYFSIFLAVFACFLQNFIFSSNRITRDGAKYLSDFLKTNTTLKILDLGYNRLEDDGAIAIADALVFANTSLLK
jgi:hypothetical protein